jgi:hypothetical protein
MLRKKNENEVRRDTSFLTMTNLRWDGSFLGTFSRKCIVCKIQTKNTGLVHHRLVLNLEGEDNHVMCQMKRYRNVDLPCVLDELKTVFGVSKVGTHHIQIGKTHYVLYRSHLKDCVLTKLLGDEKHAIVSSMQQNILYRMLMCIPEIQNAHFLCRPGKGALSFHETKTLIDKENVCPTESFLCYWFGDESIDQHFQAFFKPHSSQEEWLSYLMTLKKELETVVERVHPDYIWMVAHIIERIHKCVHL